MINRLALGLLFSALFLTSCGEEESSGSDGMSLAVSSTAILIPASSKDCTFANVEAAYFSLSKVSINWEKTDYDLQVAYLKMEVQGSGLSSEYNKVIDGDDFSKRFVYVDGSSTKQVTNSLIPAPTSTTEPRVIQLDSVCSLKFGGLSIADENKNFSATGTLTIQGIGIGNVSDTSASNFNLGEEIPVRVRAKVNIEYNLN